MGNTPRASGGILADAYGFDAVAYLDVTTGTTMRPSKSSSTPIPEREGPTAPEIKLQLSPPMTLGRATAAHLSC